MTGAVLNTLNIRLEAETLANIFEHAETKVLLTDREFSPQIKVALSKVKRDILVIDIDDPETESGEYLGMLEYEAFLAEGDPEFEAVLPEDDWQAVSLNYTSGTTGIPKGVVYHTRGAYLLATGNVLAWEMPHRPVYLWTLPMFHCNGWCFPWSIAAVAGTNICLRRVNAANIFAAIADHGVTHFCGAPIVLNFVVNATDEARRDFDHTVNVMTAAAPPPASTLEQMQRQGFNVTHVYGLTETYGPAVICAWHEEWNDRSTSEQAELKSRQGVNYHMLQELQVMDPDTMTPVPNDGETMGEVMFRGNVVMKGYLKKSDATDASLAGGWFHSGDLGVVHTDGYLQLKDRSKDVIKSGGEWISSIDLENAAVGHPDVAEAAVIGVPHPKWDERPILIVVPAKSRQPAADDILGYLKGKVAKWWLPDDVVFVDEIPHTATVKISKVQLRQTLKDYKLPEA